MITTSGLQILCSPLPRCTDFVYVNSRIYSKWRHVTSKIRLGNTMASILDWLSPFYLSQPSLWASWDFMRTHKQPTEAAHRGSQEEGLKWASTWMSFTWNPLVQGKLQMTAGPSYTLTASSWRPWGVTTKIRCSWISDSRNYDIRNVCFSC